MANLVSRMGKVSIVVAMLLASAAFCLVGLLSPVRFAASGQSTSGPVIGITLTSSLSNNTINVGDSISVTGGVTLSGGPSQVLVTVTVPVNGANQQGSFETTLDENATWIITTPPFKVRLKPGSYSATITATAGGCSDTKVMQFTVNAGP